MALLFDARFRALDSSGNPLVGATLTIDVANSPGTPASIFSDVGLSVPMTNPTSGADVSDAGGWFPQIFAAEGTVVDITLKNSLGVTIKTYEDVTFLGSDTGDFNRTVTGSGRIKITGAAGEVLIQAGSPSPDNIGGDLTIEGWAGTQLETLTLDGALVNITGRIKEGGKKLPGIVYTPETPFSAVTNVDIALANDPTGVTQWDVDIWDFALSGSDDPIIQFSFDGAATYKTTALDYVWTRQFFGTGAAATVGSGTSGAGSGYIQLMTGGTNVANKPASFRIRIYTPNSGSNFTKASWQGEFTDTVGLNKVSGVGNAMTGNGRATHMRLDTSGSNTITGKYRVVPLRGTGET